MATSTPDGGASVTEGLATVYFPSEKGVFYNPPQIPNRDLSVLALRHFAKTWQREQAEKVAQQKERSLAKAAKCAELGDMAAAAYHAGAGGDAAAAAAYKAQADAAGQTAPDYVTAAASAATPATSGGSDDVANAADAADAADGSSSSAEAGIRVLDVMTASGLRALRYVKEIDEVTQVVANDMSTDAVAALRENIRRNGISESVIVPSTGDAVDVMHQSKPPGGQRFEAVELDPYGTAAPFLDSAMQCAAEGGLLMVTCTDLAVLAGAYPEKCHANYGSYPLKAKYCHEAALRIVLSCMESHANRHKRYIVPLLSVHINFYVRLFVRVYTSPAEVKKSATKLSQVYQCSGCDTYSLQPLARIVERNGHEKIVPGQGPPVSRECEHCGRVHHVGGPIWSAPMHDQKFIAELLGELSTGRGAELASAKRLTGMLTSLLEELPDVPLFHQLSHMCGVLHVPAPTMLATVSALMRQGYRVSRSHTDPSAIKTDAPNRALWDVLRCHVQTQPKRTKGLSDTSPAHAILAIAPLVQADFTPTKEAIKLLEKKDGDGNKLGRFMPNPDEWGPGSKSTSHAKAFSQPTEEGGVPSQPSEGVEGIDTSDAAGQGAMLEKRERNQNKRARKRQAREMGTTAAGDDDDGGGETGQGDA